jgi:hypothetical protein
VAHFKSIEIVTRKCQGKENLDIQVGRPMDVYRISLCPLLWTSKLGYPWTSKKRTSLGSVKNLGKIENITSSGIEPGTPACHASVMHQCYSCSY